MLDDAMPLWLNLIEPPESCYPTLEALILEKRVLTDDVWARIRRWSGSGPSRGRSPQHELSAAEPDPRCEDGESGDRLADAMAGQDFTFEQPHASRARGVGYCPHRPQRPAHGRRATGEDCGPPAGR